MDRLSYTQQSISENEDFYDAVKRGTKSIPQYSYAKLGLGWRWLARLVADSGVAIGLGTHLATGLATNLATGLATYPAIATAVLLTPS